MHSRGAPLKRYGPPAALTAGLFGLACLGWSNIQHPAPTLPRAEINLPAQKTAEEPHAQRAEVEAIRCVVASPARARLEREVRIDCELDYLSLSDGDRETLMTITALDTGTTDLLAALDEGVLTLTLNRPEARNAMSRAMNHALRAPARGGGS
jgi:hypothetical protein